MSKTSIISIRIWTFVWTAWAALILSSCGGSGNGSGSETKPDPPPLPISTTPSAPQNFIATVGDTLVRLNWEAPSNDGGSPITHYQYRMFIGDNDPAPNWVDIPDGNDTDTSPNNETQYEVTNLLNNTAYTFQTRSVNSVGSSELASAQATPQEAPCNNPNLASRTEIWRATLNVGHTQPSYGFIEPDTGALSNKDFTIDSNNYTISQLTVSEDGKLQIQFSSTLTTEEKASFQLHVCDQTFEFSAATNMSQSYEWTSTNLDWSLAQRRFLWLSQPDTVAPELRQADGATVNRNELFLSFNENLKEDSLPEVNAFSISIDGNAGVEPTGIRLSGNQIILTLPTPVTNGQTVAVSYTPPASNSLRDFADNEAIALSSEPVTNHTGLPTVAIAAVYPSATPGLAEVEFEVTLSETRSENTEVQLEITQVISYLSSNSLTITIPANQISATEKFASSYTGQTNGEIVATVVSDISYAPASAPNHQASVQVVIGNPSISISFVDNTVSATEGQSFSVPILARTASSIPSPREDLTFNVLSTEAIAKSAIDYNDISSTISISASDWTSAASVFEAQKTVTISTLSDSDFEGNEVFLLQIEPPSASERGWGLFCQSEYNINNRCSSVLTISDDDGSLEVTSIAVTSSPSADSTYKISETIQFNVTFNGVVSVTGVPQFSLHMGSFSRRTDYISGSESKELVFSYTIVDGDNDGDGISWAANGLSLNGGTIQLQSITSGSFSNNVVNANLDHAAAEAQSNHKVNTPPSLLMAEVNGDQLTLTYSEDLSSSSQPASSDFSVSVDGAAGAAPSTVTISGPTVTLTLSSAVTVAQTVTLTYTKPNSNPIQDMANTTAEGFADQSVTNITPALPPSAPQDLAATLGNEQATLTWVAPIDDGGATITHYEYRYKTTGEFPATWTTIPDGDDQDSDTGNETTFTVTNLTNEQLHTFQLQAVNRAGASPPTSDVEVTPSNCTSGVGDGSSTSNPIIICNYNDLKAIKDDAESGPVGDYIRKHYALARDIDASPSWGEQIDEEGEPCGPFNGTDLATEAPCSGWNPIRNFAGSVDGRGHTISNLYIYYSPTDNNEKVGLFADISAESQAEVFIKNLHLRQFWIEGRADNIQLGTLAGNITIVTASSGSFLIDNVSVEGTQIKGTSTIDTVAGGLIGFIESNSSSSPPIITNSYVRNTHVEAATAGGLAGYIRGFSVYNVYAKGGSVKSNVTEIQNETPAGGLFGYVLSTPSDLMIISYSFADMEVDGRGSPAGSLIGVIKSGEDTDSTKVNFSYGVGSVTGLSTNTNVNGLIGFLYGNSPNIGPSTHNFWDTQTTEQASSVTHANLTSTGLTTAQMKSSCTGASPSNSICSLSSAFVFSSGSYPKLKKCTTCSQTNPVFSNELLEGQ